MSYMDKNLWKNAKNEEAVGCTHFKTVLKNKEVKDGVIVYPYVKENSRLMRWDLWGHYTFSILKKDEMKNLQPIGDYYVIAEIDKTCPQRSRSVSYVLKERSVCPNCGQWQRPDCLNECKKRGFVE